MEAIERCPSIGPDGTQCGQDAGHTGPHTVLTPSDARWEAEAARREVAMEAIEFTVPAIPVAQPRPRAVKMGESARVHEVTHIKNKDGTRKPHPIAAFKASVRHEAAAVYRGPPLEGPLQFEAVFVMPRPGNLVWKTKPMPRAWYTNSRNDFDNLAKGLCDALTGLLWRDDGQLCRVTIERVVAAGDEPPHVEVRIRRV